MIFGRILTLTAEQVTIQDAEFLVGEAAESAAQADGKYAPNSFYLREFDTTRTLRVDPGSPVKVTGHPEAAHLHSWDYFWLTVQSDVVVGFEG